MREFSLLIVVCVGGYTAFATYALIDTLRTGEGMHMYTQQVTTVCVGWIVTFLAFMLFRATPKKPTDIW
jgi:fluoride ion exporter CrcB/FEX